MRRRDVLHGGAGLLAIAALRPLSARALADDAVTVTLRSVVVPGGLAFNGSVPGPLLRVAHGQRVRVRYISDVDVPTSIHWHGMLLPNAMDGVAWVTQPPVRRREEFVYEFAPGPPGTRWYHDHAFHFASVRGLFGMFVVEDPKNEPAHRDFALVFHDVADWRSLQAAVRGLSTAPMTDPMGSSESMKPSERRMGDEVAYVAHRINGASYPQGKKLAVRVGERVRLRILNASPTQTRYVRFAGHEMIVTHADGNPLVRPVAIDALRVAAGERYDALVDFRRPGAFLLQGISRDPLEAQQAVVFYSDGMENALPQAESPMLDGLRVFSYELAGGGAPAIETPQTVPTYDLTLGGGGWGNPRWTIDDRIWPHTRKLLVRRGERVAVRFRNVTGMDHPMHLHGHVFALSEVNGVQLARPLAKDGALVDANGGTATWSFSANSPPGRWMLHCHNDVHMAGGMMTELIYDD